MDIFLIAILTLGAALFAMRLSLMPRLATVLWALVAAAVVVLAEEWTSGLSRTLLADATSSSQALQDLALLCTIDVAVALYQCTQSERRKRWKKVVLTLLPSILFFSALIVVEAQAFYEFTGVDFGTVAWCLAGVVAAAVVVVGWVIEKVLPEVELRQELTFILGVALGLLAIVGTVNQGAQGQLDDNFELGPLIAMVVLIVVVGGAGFLWYKKKISKLNS